MAQQDEAPKVTQEASTPQVKVSGFGRFPIEGTGFDKELVSWEGGKVLAIIHRSKASQYQKLCSDVQEAEAWVKNEIDLDKKSGKFGATKF